MEDGINVKAEVVCPGKAAERKDCVKTLGMDFSLSETHEEYTECPYCGGKIHLRVKTKGIVTEETRKAAFELKKTARGSLLMLVSAAAAIIAAALLEAFIGGDITEAIGNVVIFTAALFFIAGLLYFAVYAKYLGNPEKAVIKYERKHPYMVSIIDSGHYFKDSFSRRGNIKSNIITCDEYGIRQ